MFDEIEGDMGKVKMKLLIKDVLKDIEKEDPINFNNAMYLLGFEKIQKKLIKHRKNGEVMVNYWRERENFRKNNKIGDWSD